MRSPPIIHSRYQQLGLKFILFAAEILFNKGLSQIYQGRAEQGMADLLAAQSIKATEEHDVIDEAIQNRGEGYTVFSIVSNFGDGDTRGNPADVRRTI
jgi:hypothetical protein